MTCKPPLGFCSFLFFILNTLIFRRTSLLFSLSLFPRFRLSSGLEIKHPLIQTPLEILDSVPRSPAYHHVISSSLPPRPITPEPSSARPKPPDGARLTLSHSPSTSPALTMLSAGERPQPQVTPAVLNSSTVPVTKTHAMPLDSNPGSSSTLSAMLPDRPIKPLHVQHIWIVTGPAGCGKSTVGEGLRKELGLPFLEGDDVCQMRW